MHKQGIDSEIIKEAFNSSSDFSPAGEEKIQALKVAVGACMGVDRRSVFLQPVNHGKSDQTSLYDKGFYVWFRKDSDRKDSDRKGRDRKESDRRESARKESDRKESDRQDKGDADAQGDVAMGDVAPGGVAQGGVAQGGVAPGGVAQEDSKEVVYRGGLDRNTFGVIRCVNEDTNFYCVQMGGGGEIIMSTAMGVNTFSTQFAETSWIGMV